ncbi:MAG: hypothetical protein MUC87_06505 [Bacteroidia bacterium]|nr:hypothetical protein [Bacteroidia bacterium]
MELTKSLQEKGLTSIDDVEFEMPDGSKKKFDEIAQEEIDHSKLPDEERRKIEAEQEEELKPEQNEKATTEDETVKPKEETPEIKPEITSEKRIEYWAEDQLTHEPGNPEYLKIMLNGDPKQIITLKREKDKDWIVQRGTKEANDNNKLTNEEILERVPERYRNKYQPNEVKYKDGWTKERVLSKPKGEREVPEIYLSNDYIENHLSIFEKEGIVSRIVLKTAYDKYGIGKPDKGKTEFVSLKSDIDKLISDSNGDIEILSSVLGVSKEQLSGGLVRVDFYLNSQNKVHMPSGNEFGTNSQWIPGGKLPTGQLEAIIKTEGLIVNVDYIVKDITW